MQKLHIEEAYHKIILMVSNYYSDSMLPVLSINYLQNIFAIKKGVPKKPPVPVTKCKLLSKSNW